MNQTIESLKKDLSPEIDSMLAYEEDRQNLLIRIKPTVFLGVSNFTKIATVVRKYGGKYVSKGKNSHFAVPCSQFEENKEVLLHKAGNLELAARYEDAAQVYEKLRMYEKAGETRRKGMGISNAMKEKETIIKEVVMIPCAYCGGLMPQTSVFCPDCGARRKA